MFSFFKKSPPSARPPARPASRRSRPLRPVHLDPLPVGEVTEGNSEEDWSAWENSVLEMDSRMGANSSQFDDTKPSALVKKKSR
jgi:hypothetical protein